MKYKDHTGIVSPQYTGKSIEAESSVKLNDDKEAKDFYKKAKKRLLKVNKWHKIAGGVTAKFTLLNKSGKEVTRDVQKGDYFKIDIPAPGTQEGKGFDWVHVEDLKEVNNNDIQSVGFRVRPCSNPFSENNETAHFYGEESTSSFIVSRENAEVIAMIIDHNIKPNPHAKKLTDKIRNAVVGAGAMGFFSKMQWQQLADGLVSKE